MIASTSIAFCRNMCLIHIAVSPLECRNERTRLAEEKRDFDLER